MRGCGAGEKAALKSVDSADLTELESLRTMYDQAVRERDDVQRAYTHARQEVDILLHSMHQMKAERDRAMANYQSAVTAPASSTAPSNHVAG